MKRTTVRGALAAVLGVVVAAGCATVGPDPAAPVVAPAPPVSAPAAKPAPVEKPVRPEVVRIALLATQTTAYADGTIDRRVLYTYEPGTNRLLAEEHVDGAGETIKRVSYEYDGGLPVRKVTLDAVGILLSYREYTHTPWGVATDTLFDAEERRQSRSVYEYDEEERLSAWSVYDGSDALLGNTRYVYEGERLHRVRIHGLTGALDGVVEYTYDGEGRMIRETVRAATGDVEKYVEYLYSGEYLVEERYHTASGALRRCVAYEYDDGRISGVRFLDRNGNVGETRTRTYLIIELPGAEK